jgi:sugar lactone lactonase YvrE
MNDGACDPQGRFWAGTMADDHRDGGGALYRLDRFGQTELVLGDLTMSNGLGWSSDGRTLYLVDSGPRVVYAFAFDSDRGTISPGRILVTVAEEVGAPDGMTVDAAGDLLRGGLRGRPGSPVFPRRSIARGCARPGQADHLLRVRWPWAEPALRHHRNRELER